MSHLKFVMPQEHFTINVPSAIEAVEAKRLEFIKMMEELYAIGYMSVVTLDFQVKDRGKNLYAHVYLRMSITGVIFNVKVTLLNESNTLNAMLRYSHSSVAKQTVNKHIRDLITSTKQQISEK